MSSSEDTFVGLNIEWGSFTGDLAHFQDCPQIIINKYHNEGCVLSNYNIGTIGAVNSYVKVDGHSLYNNTLGPNYSAALYVLTAGGFEVHGVSDGLLNMGNTNSTWYRFLDFNNVAPKRIQISGYNKANYNGPAAPSLGDSVVEMGLVEDRDVYAHILGTGFVIDPAIATNSVVINPAGYIGIGVGGASNITARLDVTSGTNNGRVRITSEGPSAALKLHGWTGVTSNFNTFWLSTGRGTGGNHLSIMRPNNFVNGIGGENTNMVDALMVFRDSGHVAVGYTNDSGAVLDISGGGTTNGHVRLDSVASAAYVKMHGWNGSTSNYNSYWLATGRGPNSNDFSVMRPFNGATNIGSENMADALTVFRDTGHVGIGQTTDSGAILDVGSGVNNGRIRLDSAAAYSFIKLHGWTGSGNNFHTYWLATGRGSSGADFSIMHPSNFVSPIGSESMVDALMVFRDSGHVAIGPTTDNGKMLHVAGTFQLDGGASAAIDSFDTTTADSIEKMSRWTGAGVNYSTWYRVVGGATGLDYVIQRPSNGGQPIGSETMVPALILRRDTGGMEISGPITATSITPSNVGNNALVITDGGGKLISGGQPYGVRIEGSDTVTDYLGGKLRAGSNITFVTNNPGGYESITISAAGAGGGGPTNLNFLPPLTLSGTNVSIAPAGIDNTLLRSSPANSVMGRPSNTPGSVTDMQALSDELFLGRRAGTLGFYSPSNVTVAAGSGITVTPTASGTFTTTYTVSTPTLAVTNYALVAGSNVTITTNISGTNVTWTVNSTGSGTGGATNFFSVRGQNYNLGITYNVVIFGTKWYQTPTLGPGTYLITACVGYIDPMTSNNLFVELFNSESGAVVPGSEKHFESSADPSNFFTATITTQGLVTVTGSATVNVLAAETTYWSSAPYINAAVAPEYSTLSWIKVQ
jgi:hypothetical protein